MTSTLDVWPCRQCGGKMDNLTQRCQKKEVCDDCGIENRKLRTRINYLKRKVLKK